MKVGYFIVVNNICLSIVNRSSLQKECVNLRGREEAERRQRGGREEAERRQRGGREEAETR